MCSVYVAHLDNVEDGAIGSREANRTEGNEEDIGAGTCPRNSCAVMSVSDSGMLHIRCIYI